MDQTMSGECRIKSFETQPTGYNREMPRIIHKMVKHIKNHARFLMCFTILWTPGILVISHIASTVFELAYALLH